MVSIKQFIKFWPGPLAISVSFLASYLAKPNQTNCFKKKIQQILRKRSALMRTRIAKMYTAVVIRNAILQAFLCASTHLFKGHCYRCLNQMLSNKIFFIVWQVTLMRRKLSMMRCFESGLGLSTTQGNSCGERNKFFNKKYKKNNKLRNK